MKKLKFLSLIVIVFMLAVMPLVAGAAMDKTGDNIYIGPNEVINGNVFKAGNVILIEGTINGDLFVAGSMVTIKGTVAGSVFAAGSNVDISGNIGGSVFAAGSSVTVSAKVGGSLRVAGSNVAVDSQISQNAYLVGANINIQDSTTIGWDLMSGGASVNIAGDVSRNADLSVSSATLSGKVGGDMYVEIDSEGSVALLPTAVVAGDLTYKGYREDVMDIADGAIVSGETTFTLMEYAKKDANKMLAMFAPFFVIYKLLMMIGLMIVGFVVIRVAKPAVKEISSNMMKNPWSSIGWGAVSLFLTPIVIILLLVTIIGAPLAFITGLLYAVALYMAKVLASLLLGMSIIGAIKKTKNPNLYLSMIVGTILFVIVVSIPIIGWILGLLAMLWALGGIAVFKQKLMFKK